MSAKNAREMRQATLDKLQNEQKKEERKKRNILVVLVALPALILFTVAGLVIYNASKGSGLESVPASAAGMGQPFVLNPDAPESVPVVDIYEDFQCPYCGILENTLGDSFRSLADNDEAKVQVYLMNFLDGSLGNDSSTNAIRAAAAADEQGKFAEFHAILYQNQPAVEGQGWTAAEFEQFAEEAGVEDLEKWRSSFKSDQWDAYIDSIQKASTDAGVTGTPTIMLDGEVVTDQITDEASLRALVAGDAVPAPVETVPESEVSE